MEQGTGKRVGVGNRDGGKAGAKDLVKHYSEKKRIWEKRQLSSITKKEIARSPFPHTRA